MSLVLHKELGLYPLVEVFMDPRTLVQASLFIMVWNCLDACSKQFTNTLNELLRLYSPSILALVKTRISGANANEVCPKVDFDGACRVEAQDFRGGI